MTKREKDKQMAVRLLAERVEWEMQGWSNAVEDGDMTKEEFQALLNQKEIKKLVEREYKEAHKKGRLVGHSSWAGLEIKHLNFLGKSALLQVFNETTIRVLESFDRSHV